MPPALPTHGTRQRPPETDSRPRPALGYNRGLRTDPLPILEDDMDAKTVDRRAQHQPRLEDDPLVRGLGRYAADAPLTGQTYAYFVRSSHAFADIRSIDTEAAKAVPGVLAVLTATDMEGIGNISQHPPLAGRGGQKLIIPHRPALAGETVRHVGEAVAVVIAETLTAAQDG